MPHKVKVMQLRRLLKNSLPYRLYLKIKSRYLLRAIRKAQKNFSVKFLFVNGLRRSGNHFLINIIFNSLDRRIFFYNNICGFSDVASIKRISIKRGKRKELLVIFGFEDHQYANFVREKNWIAKQLNISPKKYKTICIHRDPINLICSRLKQSYHGELLQKSPQRQDNLISLINDQMSNLTNYDICINYNQFLFNLFNPDLCQFLQIEKLIDARSVWPHGGGSSFSGTQDVEDKELYIKRFEKCIDQKIFIKLVERALSEKTGKHFPDIVDSFNVLKNASSNY